MGGGYDEYFCNSDDGCSALDCHSPDTEWILMGVYRQEFYQYLEQISKHLWAVDDYEYAIALGGLGALGGLLGAISPILQSSIGEQNERLYRGIGGPQAEANIRMQRELLEAEQQYSVAAVLTGLNLSAGTNPTAVISVVAGDNVDSADFGYTASGGAGSIGNFVWHDIDGSGDVNGSEVSLGLQGITIDLYLDVNGNGEIEFDEFVQVRSRPPPCRRPPAA